ncbi:MAG TPA: class I SAM-dependent methyltransferase [Gammaproteobacteria bacterium]
MHDEQHAGSRRARWNARWARRDYAGQGPIAVLADYAHLLPARGRALDLACGLGLNALFLAARGLESHAWDYSETAIARLRAEAAARGLQLQAEVRDLLAAPPAPAGFDVIVVSRFLERGLCPAIAAALRPGGLLYYQSFVRDRVTEHGPDDHAFRLGANELLALFPGLQLRLYRDEGSLGDVTRGFRDEAQLVAQRPPG